MTPIVFVSTRGREYSPEQCERIVLARLRTLGGDLLLPGWRDVVRSRFADLAWLRSRNGCIPGALVRELYAPAIAYGR